LTIRRIQRSCDAISIVEKHRRDLRRNEKIIKIVSIDVRLNLLSPKMKILLSEFFRYAKREVKIGFACTVVFLKSLQRRRA
jgi:hypothetical protein